MDEKREVTVARIRSNTLKKALKNKKLTQEGFARLIGISFRQANRIILNKSEPSLLLAASMAAVLDDSIDNLFTLDVRTRAVREKE